MLRKVILWPVIIIVLLLILVAGGGLWLVWSNQDALAKQGIERGTTYALGVDTRVDSVRLGLFSGELHAEGFAADNPEGYQTPFLLRNESIDIALRPMSLFSDVVEVDRIEIDGLEANIEEREGKTNVEVISENLEKVSGPAEEPPAEEPGRQYRVEQIVIRNLVAHVTSPRIGDEATTVRVPEIVLDDVTPENVQGLAVAELTKRIVPAVIASVIENGAGVIPGELLENLGGSMAEVAEQLGEEGVRILEQAGGDAVEEVLGDVDPELREAVEERIGGAVRGLLGGNDEEPSGEENTESNTNQPDGGTDASEQDGNDLEGAADRIRGLFDREE